jgi:hypothetical protein
LYAYGTLNSPYLILHAVLLVLVLDEELLSCGILVLAADEVGYLLVLGLFGGGLVGLVALAQELLLDEIDSFVEPILLLFTALATSSHGIELVGPPAAGAAAALLGWLLVLVLVVDVVVVVVVRVSSKGALEIVHGCC